MGVSLSTARYLAPASFLVNFAAQQYGMLSRPNMKDIHDANLSFFSPQPFFIAAFFFPQQLIQLAWLWRLWRAPRQGMIVNANDDDDGDDADADAAAVVQMVDYAPYYALGNLCIASWMVFWNRRALATSDVFVAINTLAQLYYVAARLGPVGDNGTSSSFPFFSSSSSSFLTHTVAKTFAGIGVLDLLHNTAAAFAVNQPASTPVRVLTGLGFGALAARSDWVFGGCLVYDLVALAVGQRAYGQPGWSNLLGVYAVGTAAIVSVRNWRK